MPSIEWFNNKIAHRSRKQKYHEENGNDEKALWNKNEIQKLESMLEQEHGFNHAEAKTKLNNLYEEIAVLKDSNPNSPRIQEAYQEVQEIKKVISSLEVVVSETNID